MIDDFAMDRRGLLQRALILVGAGAHLSACGMLSPASAGSPFRFSSGQMATISAAADIIVPRTETPGTLDAGVPALFEGLMADWAAPETRETLVGVIARIEALGTDGRPFAALDNSEQVAVLSAHDRAALSTEVPLGQPVPADPGYALFKDLVLTLYYYSEQALTQELDYIHVPGRWDPSVPVTPKTRPSGAPSAF